LLVIKIETVVLLVPRQDLVLD